MWNSSIWSIDGSLSGATPPGLSGLGNKGVLCIPQNSNITGDSPFDSWVYTHWLGVLPLYRDAVDVFTALADLADKSNPECWAKDLEVNENSRSICTP